MIDGSGLHARRQFTHEAGEKSLTTLSNSSGGGSLRETPDDLVNQVWEIIYQQIPCFLQNSTVDKEAIIQDAWLNIMKAINRNPDLTSDLERFKGYVHVVVRNSFHDAFRREGKQARIIERLRPFFEPDFTRLESDNATLEWVETRILIEQAIKQLQGWNVILARTITLLFEYGFDLPLSALAADLQVSISTASRLRAQANAYLRRALTEQ